MISFFRKYYKAVIWVMIICFFLTLLPSIFIITR